MDSEQLRQLVEYTLRQCGWWSLGAERLVMGTIAHESAMGRFIKQVGGGPALGIAQMEPVTLTDHFEVYLKGAGKRHLPKLLRVMSAKAVDEWLLGSIPPVDDLRGNLTFAIAMCRLHYLRVSEPLPDENNIAGMARYWGKYYQTESNPAKVRAWIENFPYQLYE